jgi:hypothetical protein
VLEDGELHFMYDRAYGDIKFGNIHGLKPYYKLLNQLFIPKEVIWTISPTCPRTRLLGWLQIKMSLVSLISFGRRAFVRF